MIADNGIVHEARVGQHFIKSYCRGCPPSEARQLRWCQGRSCQELIGVAVTGDKDIKTRQRAGVVIFWWLDTFNATLCINPDAKCCQVLVVHHAAQGNKLFHGSESFLRNRASGPKEILHNLWNTKLRCLVPKILHVVLIKNQTVLVHTLKLCLFLRTILVRIFQLRLHFIYCRRTNIIRLGVDKKNQLDVTFCILYFLF